MFKFDRKGAPTLRAGQTRVYLISANLIQVPWPNLSLNSYPHHTPGQASRRPGVRGRHVRGTGEPPEHGHLSPVYLATCPTWHPHLSTCIPGHLSHLATYHLQVHVLLLPRLLASIQRLFEEEGLGGHTLLHGFAWEFVPLDYDLLSLEMPGYFRCS